MPKPNFDWGGYKPKPPVVKGIKKPAPPPKQTAPKPDAKIIRWAKDRAIKGREKTLPAAPPKMFFDIDTRTPYGAQLYFTPYGKNLSETGEGKDIQQILMTADPRRGAPLYLDENGQMTLENTGVPMVWNAELQEYQTATRYYERLRGVSTDPLYRHKQFTLDPGLKIGKPLYADLVTKTITNQKTPTFYTTAPDGSLVLTTDPTAEPATTSLELLAGLVNLFQVEGNRDSMEMVQTLMTLRQNNPEITASSDLTYRSDATGYDPAKAINPTTGKPFGSSYARPEKSEDKAQGMTYWMVHPDGTIQPMYLNPAPKSTGEKLMNAIDQISNPITKWLGAQAEKSPTSRFMVSALNLFAASFKYEVFRAAAGENPLFQALGVETIPTKHIMGWAGAKALKLLGVDNPTPEEVELVIATIAQQHAFELANQRQYTKMAWEAANNRIPEGYFIPNSRTYSDQMALVNSNPDYEWVLPDGSPLPDTQDLQYKGDRPAIGMPIYRLKPEVAAAYDRERMSLRLQNEQLMQGIYSGEAPANAMDIVYRNTLRAQELDRKFLNSDPSFAFSWAYDPSREAAYRENLARMEIQKGEPLTPWEIRRAREPYLDNTVEMIGESVLDATNLMDIFGVDTLIFDSLKLGKLFGLGVLKQAGVNGLWEASKVSDNLTGKVYRWVTTKSVRSQAAQLYFNATDLLSTLARDSNSARIFLDTIAKVSDSFNQGTSLRGAAQGARGLPPSIRALQTKQLEQMAQVIPPDQWHVLATNAKDHVFNTAFRQALDDIDAHPAIFKAQIDKYVEELRQSAPNMTDTELLDAAKKEIAIYRANQQATNPRIVAQVMAIDFRTAFLKSHQVFPPQVVGGGEDAITKAIGAATDMAKTVVRTAENREILDDTFIGWLARHVPGLAESQKFRQAAEAGHFAVSSFMDIFYTMVLTARFGWVVTNYIDTGLRFLVNGLGGFDSIFDNLTKIFDDIGEIPSEMSTSVSRRTIGAEDSPSYRVAFQGERPLPGLLGWAGYFKYNWKKADFQWHKPGIIRTLADIVRNGGVALKVPFNATADLNSAIEFVFRVRLYHKFYTQNHARLLTAEMDKILGSITNPVHRAVAEKIWLYSGSNPKRILEMTKKRGGWGALTSWIPEDAVALLKGMTPQDQSLFINSIVMELQRMHDEAVKAGRRSPSPEDIDAFFDNVLVTFNQALEGQIAATRKAGDGAVDFNSPRPPELTIDGLVDEASQPPLRMPDADALAWREKVSLDPTSATVDEATRLLKQNGLTPGDDPIEELKRFVDDARNPQRLIGAPPPGRARTPEEEEAARRLEAERIAAEKNSPYGDDIKEAERIASEYKRAHFDLGSDAFQQLPPDAQAHIVQGLASWGDVDSKLGKWAAEHDRRFAWNMHEHGSIQRKRAWELFDRLKLSRLVGWYNFQKQLSSNVAQYARGMGLARGASTADLLKYMGVELKFDDAGKLIEVDFPAIGYRNASDPTGMTPVPPIQAQGELDKWRVLWGADSQMDTDKNFFNRRYRETTISTDKIFENLGIPDVPKAPPKITAADILKHPAYLKAEAAGLVQTDPVAVARIIANDIFGLKNMDDPKMARLAHKWFRAYEPASYVKGSRMLEILQGRPNQIEFLADLFNAHAQAGHLINLKTAANEARASFKEGAIKQGLSPEHAEWYLEAQELMAQQWASEAPGRNADLYWIYEVAHLTDRELPLDGLFLEVDGKPVFFSPLERAFETMPQGKWGRASDLLNLLQKGGIRGLKADEMEFTGLLDFLRERGDSPITKQEIGEWLRSHQIRIEEIKYWQPKGLDTRYKPEIEKISIDDRKLGELSDKSLHAATHENPIDYLIYEDVSRNLAYRIQIKPSYIPPSERSRARPAKAKWDVILKREGTDPRYFRADTLSGAYDIQIRVLELYNDVRRFVASDGTSSSGRVYDGLEHIFGLERYGVNAPRHSSRWTMGGHLDGTDVELLLTLPDYPAHSHAYAHWRGERKVFAHLRMNVRVGADGEQWLVIEEVQSDLHQALRGKGSIEERKSDFLRWLVGGIRMPSLLGQSSAVGQVIAARIAGEGLWDGATDEVLDSLLSMPDSMKKFVRQIMETDQFTPSQLVRQLGEVLHEADQREAGLEIFIRENLDETALREIADHMDEDDLIDKDDLIVDDYVDNIMHRIESATQQGRYVVDDIIGDYGEGTRTWMLEAYDRYTLITAAHLLENYVRQNLATFYPFSKNWHEVALRRALRYAQDNGFTRIAWTTGAVQGLRYSMGSTDDRLLGMSKFYDGDLPKFFTKIGTDSGVAPTRGRLNRGSLSPELWLFDFTNNPKLQDQFASPQPLYLKTDAEQRASILFARDGRSLIRGFTKSLNLLDLMHETGHTLMRRLDDVQWVTTAKWLKDQGIDIDADTFKRLHDNYWNAPDMLTPDEKELYVKAQEAFANGYVKWFAEGMDIADDIQGVFQKISLVIKQLYDQFIKGTSLEVNLSDEMRRVYRQLSDGAPLPGQTKKVRQMPKLNWVKASNAMDRWVAREGRTIYELKYRQAYTLAATDVWEVYAGNKFDTFGTKEEAIAFIDKLRKAKGVKTELVDWTYGTDPRTGYFDLPQVQDHRTIFYEHYKDTFAKARDSREQIFGVVSQGKLPMQGIDTVMLMLDARAKVWSIWTGMDTNDWWAKFTPYAALKRSYVSGKINWTNNKRGIIAGQAGALDPQGYYVIRFFGSANLETAVHESAHIILYDTIRLATQIPEVAAELAKLERWMGLQVGELVDYHNASLYGALTPDQIASGQTATGAIYRGHEKFAEHFVYFLREGLVPDPEVKSIFETIKRWVIDLYKTWTNTGAGYMFPTNELTDEIREVMTRMISADATRQLRASLQTQPHLPPNTVIPPPPKNLGAGIPQTFSNELRRPEYERIRMAWDSMDDAERYYVYTHDITTGMFNGRGLTERLLDWEKNPERAKKVAIYLDGRNLKWWNDGLGDGRIAEAGGDNYIMAVANILNEKYVSFRLHDTGDEFMVFADNVADAERIVQEIQQALADTAIEIPYADGSRRSFKGASLRYGIAEADSPADAVQKAKIAYTDAKNAEINATGIDDRSLMPAGIEEVGISETELHSETLDELGITVTPHVGTEAWKKWFKNSKAVDRKGKPLMLFHGTTGDFDTFKPNRAGQIGFHVGTSQQAEDFTKQYLGDRVLGFRKDGNIMPVYISAQNPLVIDYDPGSWFPSQIANILANAGYIDQADTLLDQLVFLRSDYGRKFEALAKEFRERVAKGEDMLEAHAWVSDQQEILTSAKNKAEYDASIAALERAGFDSIKYLNEVEGKIPEYSWLVLHPEQIKSRFNDGSFDIGEPSIVSSRIDTNKTLQAAGEALNATPDPDALPPLTPELQAAWEAYLRISGFDQFTAFRQDTPSHFIEDLYAYLDPSRPLSPELAGQAEQLKKIVEDIQSGTWAFLEQLEDRLKTGYRHTPTEQVPAPISEFRKPDGVITYGRANMGATAQAVNARKALEVWRKYLKETVTGIEDGTTIPWWLSEDDEFWKVITAWGVDAAKAKQDILNIAKHGGKLGDVEVKGAIDEVNRIMLDYTQYYHWENPLRFLYPFWMFPTRSLPFWLRTFVEHPEILSFYMRYQDLSRRQRIQNGAVNSKGEPLPSLEGYAKVPGTELWVNYIAPLSFRYAIPLITEWDYGDAEADESPSQWVFRWLYEFGRDRGFSPNPLVMGALGLTQEAWGFGGIDSGKFPNYSMFPIADLLPPWYQRSILGALRRMDNPDLSDTWTIQMDWQDYLIERYALAQTLEQMEATTDEVQKWTLANQLLNTLKEVDEKGNPLPREENPVWLQFRQEVEQTQYWTNFAGYFTGFYPKQYTDAEAELYKVRDEINILRENINNQANAELFGMLPSDMARYEHYSNRSFNTTDGYMYQLYNVIRYVTGEDGNPLEGQERRDRIAERIHINEVTNAYYETRKAARDRFDQAMAVIPIGSPWERKQPIFEKYYAELARIESNRMFADAKRTWSPSVKPEQMVFEHALDIWFSLIKTTRPVWDTAGGESYTEYKTRLAEWEASIPAQGKLIQTTLANEAHLAAQELINTPLAVNEVAALSPNDLYWMSDTIVEQMIAASTLPNYNKWLLDNDTPNEALDNAWSELYYTNYFETLDGLSGELRTQAELEWRKRHPQPPTFEELYAWIRKTYGNRFGTNELRTIYESGSLDIDERLTQQQPEQDQESYTMIQEMFDILSDADPGAQERELRDAYLDLGGDDSDLDILFKSHGATSAWADKTELQAAYARLQKAAQIVGITSPDSLRMVERVEVERINAGFRTSVTQQYGSDIYDLLGRYSRMSSSEKENFRETQRDQYLRIQGYYAFRDAFASRNPLWAKYYYPDYDPTAASSSSSGSYSYSGGGGGGYYSGKGYSNSSYNSNYLDGNTDLGGNWRTFNVAGYRSTLDPHSLLAKVGTGKAAGAPVWSRNMLPKEVQEAVGEVALTSIEKSLNENKPVAKSTLKWLKTLADKKVEYKLHLRPLIQAFEERM